MIRWTGLAPWEFEFPFPGSLTSTFRNQGGFRPDKRGYRARGRDPNGFHFTWRRQQKGRWAVGFCEAPVRRGDFCD